MICFVKARESEYLKYKNNDWIGRNLVQRIHLLVILISHIKKIIIIKYLSTVNLEDNQEKEKKQIHIFLNFYTKENITYFF